MGLLLKQQMSVQHARKSLLNYARVAYYTVEPSLQPLKQPWVSAPFVAHLSRNPWGLQHDVEQCHHGVTLKTDLDILSRVQ